MDNSRTNPTTSRRSHSDVLGYSLHCHKLSSLLRTILFLSILLPSQLFAQTFSLDDTTTEYPHHGTIYANKFEGRHTSSGEIFRQSKFTAAHWKIKLGTYVLVTNTNTGLQVVVKVNDRCPKRGVFDLTRTAAHAIGIRGCQPVKIRILSEEEQSYWAQHCESQDRTDHTKNPNSGTSKGSITTKKTSETTSSATNSLTTPATQTSKDSVFYDIKLCDVQTLEQARETIREVPMPYQDMVEARPSSKNSSIEVVLKLTQHKESAAKVQKKLSNTFPNSALLEVKKN